MSQHEATTPSGVRHLTKSKVVEITWEDGHVSRLPLELLRGWCPCATCQGHGPETVFHPGGNSELVSLGEVGHYALSFGWADGHDTGIYTFERLRGLCPCCSEEKRRL